MSDTECEQEEAGHSRTVDKKAVDLVRLALAFEYKKQPLKRTDINQMVFPAGHQVGCVNRAEYKHVFEVANEKLKAEFGMELVNLPANPKPISSRTAEGRKKDVMRSNEEDRLEDVYVLRSLLPEAYRRLLSLHREPHILALITVIVGIIQLNQCDISEADLFGHLRTLGIRADDKEPDDYFGLVPEHLKQLERQRYLMSYRKQQQDDSGMTMWAIGSRSRVEIGPEVLAKFCTELTALTSQTGMDANVRKAFLAERR